MGVDAVNNQKTVEQIIKDTSSKASERNTGELGKDDFLNLLVTQLRYQDPMQPVDDKEFIGQMAQFSSLEQMQNMNQSFSAMKAYSLIGKQVTGSIVDSDTFEVKYVEGEVTNVRISNGKTFAVVNGEDVPVDRIIDVAEGGKASGGTSLSTYTHLIGYHAVSEISDPETGEALKVNGTVMEIEKLDGINYAVMGGVMAEISEIITDTQSADPDFMKDYLTESEGKVIEVKIVDRINDKRVPIEARLREFTVDEETGRISAVFDELYIPVDSIDRVTLPQGEMTLDQALLLQILEKLSGSDEEQQEPGDSIEETPAV